MYIIMSQLVARCSRKVLSAPLHSVPLAITYVHKYSMLLSVTTSKLRHGEYVMNIMQLQLQLR
jgi:hypothetical protein